MGCAGKTYQGEGGIGNGNMRVQNSGRSLKVIVTATCLKGMSTGADSISAPEVTRPARERREYSVRVQDRISVSTDTSLRGKLPPGFPTPHGFPTRVAFDASCSYVHHPSLFTLLRTSTPILNPPSDRTELSSVRTPDSQSGVFQVTLSNLIFCPPVPSWTACASARVSID